MKVTIQIPDEVYENLGGTQQSIQQQVSLRLRLLPDPIDPADKLVVVTAAARQALEQLIQRPIDAPADLVDHLRNGARITIGPITRMLSTSEAERLQVYATAHGVSIDAAAKDLFEPMIDDLLNRV